MTVATRFYKLLIISDDYLPLPKAFMLSLRLRKLTLNNVERWGRELFRPHA